jgi:hypothetical protein
LKVGKLTLKWPDAHFERSLEFLERDAYVE